MKKIALTLGLGALLFSHLTTAQATLIAYDGYGGTNVNNGGTGWTADWTGSTNALGTNLSSGNGLVTSGGSANIGYFGDGQAQRAFAASPINTGTLWVSWLQTTNPVSGQPSQIRLNNGGTTLLMFGKHFVPSNNWTIMSDGGGSVQATASVALTGTQFVVASMEFSTGTVNLYINPTGLGSGSNPLSGLAASWISGSHFASGFTNLNTTAETATMIVDEFRVGTTWGDVSPVPEPSTYALLALGLGALFFLRRRKVA